MKKEELLKSRADYESLKLRNYSEIRWGTMTQEQFYLLKSTKYKEMKSFYKDCLALLWGKGNKCKKMDISKKTFFVKNIVDDSKTTKDLRKKTGVYIFLDEKNNTKYIGVGGTTEGKSLKSRVNQELKKYGTSGPGFDTGATLSKNIQNIEEIDAEEAKKIIDEYMIVVLIVGSNKNNYERRQSQSLERLLIALYNPTYNID